MKTYIKKIIVLAALLSTIFAPAMAYADNCSNCTGQSSLSTSQAIQCGTDCASGSSQDNTQATSTVNDTIKTIIDIFSVVVGIIAVIMLIVGGLRYVTSAGSSEKVTAAKNTILYAIVGLVIVALAQVIVRFVLTNVTSNSSGSGAGGTQSQGSTGSGSTGSSKSTGGHGAQLP